MYGTSDEELGYVSYKHMKAVATDLKAIYSASTEAEAECNVELKALEMGCALPNQKPRPGERDFSRVIPLFAFPEDIRKVIYPTNATLVGQDDPAQGHAQSSHLSLR